jgi:hypothetical protein
MGERKRILIVSFSDISLDQRVLRQVDYLKESYHISTIAFGAAKLPDVEFFPLSEKRKTFLHKVRRAVRLKLRDYMGYYYDTFEIEKLKQSITGMKFDLIVANDNESLPLVFEIHNEARVLHDAHEYSPRQQEDLFSWRFLMQRYKEWTCEQYLHLCDGVTTVSQGIADEYERVYGVKPEVITNAPNYLSIEPSPIGSDKINMVHHGLASKSRKLELMVDLMELLDDRYSLDMILMPSDQRYLAEIKELCVGKKNIRVLDPLPSESLIAATNSYDIGLLIPKATSFNILHSLPNKFFEFIQARLAVAITPLPEMAAIARKYDCGIVSQDYEPSSMAKELNALTLVRLEQLKAHSSIAARELNSEANMKKLDQIVQRLLKESGENKVYKP